MTKVLVKEPKHHHNCYQYTWNIKKATNKDGSLVFYIDNQNDPWISYRKSFQPRFFVKPDLSLWADVSGHVNVYREKDGYTNKRDLKIESMICPVQIVDDEFQVSLFDGALTYRQKAKAVSCRTEKDAHLIARAACQILADSAPPMLEPHVETDCIHPRAVVKRHEKAVEPIPSADSTPTLLVEEKAV